MRGLAGVAVVAVALAVTQSAVAAPKRPPQAVAALRAVQSSLKLHRLDPATAASARAEIARAAYLIRILPSGRGEHIAVALGEIASLGNALVTPRALSLVGELKANDTYFAKHWAPAPKTDITDADGIIYRYFAGRCFEYHPLANFAALNALDAENDALGAQQLADALAARGIHLHSGGIGFEYLFPYGGPAPWLSGMAQAVAAQALARAAAIAPADGANLRAVAAAAYRAIPQGLLTTVAAGPWIRLYSFSSAPVLNAQLQTIISLRSYANVTGDAAAAALSQRLQLAAASTLPRFDTGYWTYYALPDDPSPVDYQQFVIQLLKRLGPSDPRFASAATRFAAYLREPPAFRLASGALASVRFWLSKPAWVTATSPAGSTESASLLPGWHTFAWHEPRRAGTYPIHVTAVDWAGNRASFDALPALRVLAGSRPGGTPAPVAATPPATPPLTVGVALTDPTVPIPRGVRLARVTVTWPTGATAPDPTLVAQLAAVAVPLEVQLVASPLPADDPGRAALAQYAVSLAQQLPGLRYLVLAPAPTLAAVPGYAAALTAVRAALQPVAPAVAVGPLVDGAAAPAGVVGALAPALGPTGFGVAALQPAPSPAKGAWSAADVPAFVSALQTAFGTTPPVLVDGVPAPGADAELQAYACEPGVAAAVLGGGGATASTIAGAQHGAIVCPGLAATVTPTITFPAALTPPAGAQVALTCDRDCLYLVTLERADGTPVVGRRGSLVAGTPRVVGLPRTTLRTGTYRIDVQVVARVNPGAVTRQLSAPLVVG